MRVTPSDLSSRFVLTLLTALLFIAPIDQVYAQVRFFQMTLWAQNDTAPGVDTDIPVFWDGYPQPEGPSILVWPDWTKPISASQYEWRRILAVLIDEPYNDFNSLQAGCWSLANVQAVNARAQLLAGRAAELKSVAPLTRFWVNLAKPHMDWMMGPQCSIQNLAAVNVVRSYIDVISVDIYHVAFPQSVRPYYDWLEAHRAKPEQQLALIPGTHYRAGVDNPSLQAGILEYYFEYANTVNESCDLPRERLTGSFDGCRVWIVLGWLAQNHTEGGVEYVGVRDARAGPIADVWQAELALPIRLDLAGQLKPGQVPQLFLPSLLE